MASPCVGCGYCCQKVQCLPSIAVYGPCELCPGLVWVKDENRYRCRLVLDAVTEEQLRKVKNDLAIGAGCSSSMFNTQRDEAIKRQLIATAVGVRR